MMFYKSNDPTSSVKDLTEIGAAVGDNWKSVIFILFHLLLILYWIYHPFLSQYKIK